MAFQNFSFPEVEQDLGLTLTDSDLFGQVPTVPVQPEFLARVLEGANLASAINTEKARSEFAIAPVLFELRHRYAGRLVEAKDDNLRLGLGQCLAAMCAAQLLNHTASLPVVVYGKVTTGSAWRFLRLGGNEVTIDLAEYHVEVLGKILGILGHIVETG